ncbi:MAG TPA: dockerin type I repeat-containing protein [Armatimonadota bacterium]|jgi:hypothetical protein
MKMTRRGAFYAAATLAYLAVVVGPCAAAPLDPSTSHVLYDWDKDTQGWTSGEPGVTVSHNIDPNYAFSGSSGSLKVDLTGHQTWSDHLMSVTLPEPLDLSLFGFVSVDVFCPESALGGDADSAYGQFGLITLPPEVSWGSRDVVRTGWQRFVWSLDPAQSKSITELRFLVDQGGPWQQPVYFDNLRVLPGKPQGLAPKDQILIDGFNTDANIEGMAEDWPRQITTDKTYVTEGTGALKVDLTGVTGWTGYKDQLLGLTPIDLSSMDQVRLDVYVPAASAPEWFQWGVCLLSGEAGVGVSDAIHGVNVGWQTLVWDLTLLSPEEKVLLKEVTGFRFLTQSGGDTNTDWKGPIYVDALRGSKEIAGVEATPAGVKGDVNGNGKLDISDVVAALRFVAGLTTPTAAQTTAADINGNSKVDISDIVALLRAVAGLSTL